ncbi:hypothetical protein N7536_012622 [Penicillium majusculum]|nr:hypothetical protein N7536_012622 [Penicillium majusculum]
MALTGKENKILRLTDAEDEQPRGESSIDNEAAETAAQLSSSEEVEKALAILEGRRASEIRSGPYRIVGTKSAALRESAKFKPYDRTPRRQ